MIPSKDIFNAIKADNPGAVVFFPVGDGSYETYCEDALLVADLVGAAVDFDANGDFFFAVRDLEHAKQLLASAGRRVIIGDAEPAEGAPVTRAVLSRYVRGKYKRFALAGVRRGSDAHSVRACCDFLLYYCDSQITAEEIECDDLYMLVKSFYESPATTFDEVADDFLGELVYDKPAPAHCGAQLLFDFV